MAKKKTPVTSVTPKSTVKPISKAQQARTRKLIAGIASVTPVGRAAKTTSKVIGKAIDKVTETKYLDGAYRTAGNEPGIKAALNARKVAKSFEKYYATAKANKVVKTLAEPKSVKKLPHNTAPKNGLETRGVKPTTRERINRARDLQWDKAERTYDANSEMRYTGLVSSNKGMVAARGPGKRNTRKRDAIRREANKNLPIQINSAPEKTADSTKIANAKALKAANKKKSK